VSKHIFAKPNEKTELFTVFSFKTSIAAESSQGFSLSENTKTVGKCIAAAGMSYIELVEMRCIELVEMRCIELVEM